MANEEFPFGPEFPLSIMCPRCMAETTKAEASLGTNAGVEHFKCPFCLHYWRRREITCTEEAHEKPH